MKRTPRSKGPARTARAPAPLAITWFGHSAFRFESQAGTVALVDPWLSNPVAPPGAMEIEKADAILLTHGHSDHIGETVPLALRTGARVFAIHELSLHLQSVGLTNVVGMNKSGTVHHHGMTITMVDATHSGGIETGETVLPGGGSAGFVIAFEGSLAVYHAGDTGLFGDMRLIAQLYKPHIAILPIGGLYTMGPLEAAKACELIKPRHILGMHYGTFPALTGSPVELRKLLPVPARRRLHEIAPGETILLS